MCRRKQNEGGEAILVVSEDPAFLHAAHQRLTEAGARVIGCIGPVQSPCNLLERGRCPLADHAQVALIDSPASGVFRCHTDVLPAGTYAEMLQHAHPECTVVLCGAPQGTSGPTGDVCVVADARSALALVEEVEHLSGSDSMGGRR